MINFVIENNWKWTHCRLPIKKCEKKAKKPEEEYFYQVINSEHTGPVDEAKIKVHLDKAFPFEPQTGFVWHKSWNLPEITATINEEEFNEFLEDYQEIGCEIMAVYPIKYSSSYYLNEVHVEGNCFKSLSGGVASFKFLKFGETSFNHSVYFYLLKRNMFSLLVWIYGENKYKDRNDLFCLISSPIYVDSRKEARKKELNIKNNLPIHSPKKFISNIGGAKGYISNSSEGFISYYGAQNIRNKIKNPFYIAYHFDRLFKLYYNQYLDIDLPEIISIIEPSKVSEISTSKFGDTNLILLQIIENGEKNRKKIMSIIEKWKFSKIEFSYLTTQHLEENWKEISKEEIKLAYKNYYENESLKEEELPKQEYNEDKKMSLNDNKVKGYEDEYGDNIEGEKNYELRTVINLSQPKKKVKLEEN